MKLFVSDWINNINRYFVFKHCKGMNEEQSFTKYLIINLLDNKTEITRIRCLKCVKVELIKKFIMLKKTPC